MINDLRDAFRQWRRTPVVTFAALLSLALGIGANTAIFSLLNALLLKPLPVDRPDELVSLRDEGRPTQERLISYRMYESLLQENGGLASLAVSTVQPVDLARPGEPANPARGLFVSGLYFPLLGVRAEHGRLLTPNDDERNGSARSVVVSDGFWRRQLGAAPDVVGRSITIAQQPFTIVGVVDRRFFGLQVGQTFDIALPLSSYEVLYNSERFRLGQLFWLTLVGRQAPGRSLASSQSALQAVKVQAIRDAQMPERVAASLLKTKWILVPTMASTVGARTTYRFPLLILMAIAVLVLSVACVNVASLLIERGQLRRAELAIRLSIGASRSRLVRQLTLEAAILALAGAAAGIAVGIAGSRALLWLLSTSRSPVHLDVSIDWRVAAFTIGAGTITAFAAGVLPAWLATRVDPIEAIKSGSRGIAGTARRPLGAAQALVGVQVALTFALVLGGLAFTRSFVQLTRQGLGFDQRRVQLVGVTVPNAATEQALSQTALQLQDRLQSVPGVDSTAISWAAPFGTVTYITYASVIGALPPGVTYGDEAQTFENTVSPNYFEVMGVPLLVGRPFEGPADQVDAVVVNTSFVKKFLKTETPIGHRVWLGTRQSPYDVIGVVSDTKVQSLRADPPAMAYFAWPNHTTQRTYLQFSVRSGATTPSAAAMAQAITQVLAGARVEVRSLDVEIADTVAIDRATATLASAFGALALMLASIGLYGVLAQQVGRRTGEIGVRIALGASPLRIVRLVLVQIGIVVLAGVLAGLGRSAASGRFVQPLLYAVTPMDPELLVVATLVVFSVAMAAASVPARRAALVDPMVALRNE